MSNPLASMLDELMGRDRDLAPTEKRSEIKWDDPDVCKYFIVEFCPSELFVNTRADLGPCDKIHDEHLRKEYRKSNRFERMGYEENFMRYLQGLINDVEKRIRRGHQRLALNSMQGTLNGNPANAKEEKIQMLTERINDLVQQAEELGCEGKVEEAQGIMKLCDQLNEERTQLQNQPQTDQFNEPLKAMEVCNVCGALLVVGDAQQRVEEHIMGKQHSGYARIRSFVDQKLKRAKETDEEREAKLRQEREEREKEREKEREERKKKEEERKKEKEKEREERRKERERRDKERKRSRSRSRGKRSRSKDRKRRSRSRDRRRRSRSRSRDRHRSHRHRSRSRSKRSRSHDRRSSRSRDKDRKSRQKSSEKSSSRDKDRRSFDKESKREEPKTDGVEAGSEAAGQSPPQDNAAPQDGPAPQDDGHGPSEELEPGETN